MDYDDTLLLKQLGKEMSDTLTEMSDIVKKRDEYQEQLDLLIIGNSEHIPESMSWKNKVLTLMKLSSAAIPIYKEYRFNKTSIAMYQNKIKALETRINILKKVYEFTPKG